jgi:acyl-CoA reductase-like NAD-dependent aldehyde dehydrogenase
VDNSATIAHEEIFGPVMSVIGYDDVDQAGAIATPGSEEAAHASGTDRG